MTPAPRDCPCHSGKRYKSCCAALHAGSEEAATAEALVRARYAAFALGLGRYLVRTLTTDHPDHGAGADVLAANLSEIRVRRRFMGLAFLHSTVEGDGERAEVLFYARLFERGRDCSFVELSTFRRESGSWRYESGIGLDTERLPNDPASMTLAEFLALAS